MLGSKWITKSQWPNPTSPRMKLRFMHWCLAQIDQNISRWRGSCVYLPFSTQHSCLWLSDLTLHSGHSQRLADHQQHQHHEGGSQGVLVCADCREPLLVQGWWGEFEATIINIFFRMKTDQMNLHNMKEPKENNLLTLNTPSASQSVLVSLSLLILLLRKVTSQFYYSLSAGSCF